MAAVATDRRVPAESVTELEEELRSAMDEAVRRWERRWRAQLSPGTEPGASFEFVGKVRGKVCIAGEPLTSAGLYVSWPPGRVMVPPPGW